MRIAASACTRLYIHVASKEEKKKDAIKPLWHWIPGFAHLSTYAELIGREGLIRVTNANGIL